MTVETEIYNTLEQAKQAQSRRSQRHRDGWRPLKIDKLPDGKYQITFVNGTDDPDNIPDPNQADRDRYEVLGMKIDADTITEREFVEYERIKRKLGGI